VVALSVAMVGWEAWPAFRRHTIELHAKTPIANNMGAPVALAHVFGGGGPARMENTVNPRLSEPQTRWKEIRVERTARTRPVLWVLAALALAAFVHALRRVRRPWEALALSHVWPVILLPLTCYYYSFLVLAAPLTRARRRLEAPLLALAAASQAVAYAFWWNDDRYAAQSVLVLAFCAVALAAFAPRLRKTVDSTDRDRSRRSG
jgi:hypothetical protein